MFRSRASPRPTRPVSGARHYRVVPRGSREGRKTANGLVITGASPSPRPRGRQDGTDGSMQAREQVRSQSTQARGERTPSAASGRYGSSTAAGRGRPGRQTSTPTSGGGGSGRRPHMRMRVAAQSNGRPATAQRRAAERTERGSAAAAGRGSRSRRRAAGRAAATGAAAGEGGPSKSKVSAPFPRPAANVMRALLEQVRGV